MLCNRHCHCLSRSLSSKWLQLNQGDTEPQQVTWVKGRQSSLAEQSLQEGGQERLQTEGAIKPGWIHFRYAELEERAFLAEGRKHGKAGGRGSRICWGHS